MTIRDLDRPQRFEDVYGQEEVIKVLGALAAKRVHRNLLLHGHFGSGKTTLVRIQARAWNCDAPDPETGSPCGDCEWCGKPLGSFLMEHDVAGDGGNEKVIKEVLAELAQRPLPAGKVTTVFFDEASHLTEGGCMVLLKRVEDAEENNESIVFCFATTDPERLLPQLRSRLLGLEVQALSDDAAIRYADAVVKKNGLLVEPDALALIARIESTAPRNIFRRIMRLTFTNRDTVTIGRVKLIFGLMHLDILPQLLLAIVQGDLQAQASLIAGWNIPAKDKARWLRSFIAAVYFNDILGLRITIDAKLDGISGLVRQKLVNELVATVHVDRPARLATIFERMLAYWSDLRQVRHSSDLWDGLQQFNRILSQEGEALEVAGPPSRVVPRRELLTKLSPGVSLGREFVRAEDVRRIVNAASFLIQEYGQCFNRVVSLTLWCDPEHGGTVAIDALCAALLKASDEANGIPFVCVTERDAYWTKAFVAVCVREPIGDGARISCDPVDAILAAWSQGHRADVSSKVVAPDATVAGRTRFHWNAVALLCAGMLPGLPGDGAGTGRADRLMDGPGFKLLRRPGPISGPPVKISPALGDEAIAKAHRDRLPPIFVADFEAWSHLRTGWEFNEHSDRMAEKKARELARSQIEAAWIGDAERIEDELRRLAESWPEDPTRRQRTFIGWWTRMEAVGA